MRPTMTLLPAALLLLWIPFAGPAVAEGPPTATRVVVPELKSTTVQGGVRILRGSAIKPKPALKPRPSLARADITSGRFLWAVDRAGGRILSCERGYGVMVGENVIRCNSRPLSRRLDEHDAD